ncbi:alanine--tRNA ligase [Candidatus Wolfebacteria bacterium CG03_land_8_20_14_0_80_36_15]|uniref:alanine--tRNA ligase n=1 Tax=Candidatus Wolfebacteria bacterium CG03_land_8_20_14_0_80_36_15 TaxID=1975067 RepID=A0A2M7B8B8_9BACT|nr:MAG: alanine--tRNA ligase [Candidatus Wolfebacteria bacterium CG03_land_8_20_14_0_80_36_15]
MISSEIRKSFLEFFEQRGHKIVPSSSLIPSDSSVLLTTAGMQQFKKYYTGELNALTDFGSQRIVSIQKCFRTSDIDSVGDQSHLTFFEMLGNFSFAGEYLKRSAIKWAFEYLNKELKIDFNRLSVAVFKGDSEVPFDGESFEIVKELGFADGKIIKGDRKENFWGPTGEEGPCGPTVEFYIDGLEIWNLVFNEYFKDETGLKKLANPGVDTGMGLERLLMVINSLDDVYQTDLLKPLITKIKELYPQLDKRILRILTDHIRASIFLISDEVLPSNKETGYVLRRLLRRILAYQIKNNIRNNLFPESYKIIKDKYSAIYPETMNEKQILDIFNEEELKYRKTFSRGLKELGKYKSLSGQNAFNLYQTFGLSPEIILEFAPPEAIKNFKLKDFEKEFKKHQEISRAGALKKFGGHGLKSETKEAQEIIRLHTATHLLQWALREVLGKEVRQIGSDINSERLRFDFNFNRKLTIKEIKRVGDLVNQKVKENLPVFFEEMPKEEAEKIGALAFFKQKYGDIVKVYFIGQKENPISKELCAGPHVKNTSEIGEFRLFKEEAISAGSRRIRATVD